MKLLALVLAIIGNLAATHALAEDAVVQPLTRVDCGKAGMAWDEGANVCAPRPIEVAGQPLTRSDCLNAGQTWNDGANVCGTALEVAGQPLTRPDCLNAGQTWNDGANVCGTALEVAAQPLTRPDCLNAGQTWNDGANVCGTTPKEMETASRSEAADASVQPLTRKQCKAAGLTWNAATKICDEQATGVPTEAAKEEAKPSLSSILVNIDKSQQKMTVFLDGVEQYHWPVSTGLRGYSTPSGSYAASSMNKIWYSKQWDNAPMPHAVFFTKEGHAIHGTYDVKRLGKPASHGCVRLSPENASKLFALVEKNGLENTQVVLVGLTPGGESKVANQGKPKYSRSASRRLKSGDELTADTQRPKRGGLFRRLFGGS